MNHKEFFKILVGNPPPEIEFEIEVKQRETEQMPDEAVRAYCLDLVKYTRLQDLLLTSAISRISEIETKLYKYERGMKLYKKVRKLGFFGKIKYLLTGNTSKKWLYYLKTRLIMDRSLKTLETLHECLAKELLGKIQSGEAKAGDLNVARQFLKDNGVECIPVESNPMQELMENLPDLDAVPLADL